MTAQISDRVRRGRRAYDLSGVDGYDLFEPHHLDLPLRWTTSACWRGSVCTYKISEGRLWLVGLRLGLEVTEGQPPPVVFGVTARPPGRDTCYMYRFSRLKERVDFTGGLLLGRDFVFAMYEHMGFHPGFAYREVIEVLFDAGRAFEEIDRSAELAEYRQAMLGKTGPISERRGDAARWVGERFGLRYTARRGSGEPLRDSNPLLDRDSLPRRLRDLKRELLRNKDRREAKK
jgi:hypothetical protein